MVRAIDVVRAAVAPLSRTARFRRWAPIFFRRVEPWLDRLTDGRVQITSVLVPTLVLHTVGAKSGEPRDAPLMYTPDGRGRAIVAGTNFAGARHPAWTVNLLANPYASITVHGRRLSVVASLIPESDHEATWARLEHQWPGYQSYERDSGRAVRLFLLQPVRDSAPAT